MIRLLPCLICAAAMMLPLDTAVAQGAAGGSFGNDNKSLSGSRDAPRSSAPAKRERSERRAAPRREAAPRGGGDGGGVAKFNGTWSVTSVGVTCSDSLTITSMISNGRITSANDSGTISASGAIQTVGNYSGVRVTAQGRASATSGSGTFQRSDGCTGRWTSRKQ